MVCTTDGDQLIKNWLRNKNTIEFLGIREQLNNHNFNLVEFDLKGKEEKGSELKCLIKTSLKTCQNWDSPD